MNRVPDGATVYLWCSAEESANLWGVSYDPLLAQGRISSVARALAVVP